MALPGGPGKGDIHTADQLAKCGNLLDAYGQFLESLPLFKRALELRTRELGLEHVDTIKSVNSLAQNMQVGLAFPVILCQLFG